MNFGSVDGDPAAAMRYTESKLTKVGNMTMNYLDKNAVDMQPNYDESETEAVVLPTLLPLLLMNGVAAGIGCGWTTAFAPHLAKDVFAAIDKVMADILKGEDTSVEDIIKIIKAPDFPTGGIITNINEVYKAYKEGSGTIRILSRYTVNEDKKGNQSIVITELPYLVNKFKFIEKVSNLIKDGELPELKNIEDESDKSGIKVVINLKKNANDKMAINKLKKKTQFSSTFAIRHNAVDGSEVLRNLSLKDIISHFIEHAANVIQRKSETILNKKRGRLNVVDGCIIISNDILECVKLISESNSDEEANKALKKRFGLNDEQIEYIMSRQLRSLKKISEEEYVSEKAELEQEIRHLELVTTDYEHLIVETRAEIQKVAENFKNESRKTSIAHDDSDVSDLDMINKENIVIVRTHQETIKAVRLSEYTEQRRNGKGVMANTREDDFVEEIISLTTHDDLAIITNVGKAYMLPAYKIPIVNKRSIGKYINNYINMDPATEKIIAVIPVIRDGSEDDEARTLTFVSKNGITKRLSVSDLPASRQGARVVTIRDNDEIIAVFNSNDDDYIMIVTKNGFATRFKAETIRKTGRSGSGVIGIKFRNSNDYVVSALVANDENDFLVCTDKGIGKRCAAISITSHSRGGKGVICHRPSEEGGNVVGVAKINDDETFIIITKNGMTIRVPAESIRTIGRGAKGIGLIKMQEDDEVITICVTPKDEEEEEVSDGDQLEE